MEKIDSHQHFWRYDPVAHSWIGDEMEALRKDFMPSDLKKELDALGFDGCVAVQADQTEKETGFLLELSDRYNFIKGVVGWLDLQAPDIEKRLDYFSRFHSLKGLRHVVQDEPDDRFLLRPDFLRGIEKLENYGLCYDILIFAKHLPAAIEFVSEFPSQMFVLDHLAKPEIKDQKIKAWEEGIRELAQHPKVYCKLSGIITEADWKSWTSENIKPYLDVAFDVFGPDRLMFGSDWPVCTLAGSYKRVYQLIDQYIHPLNKLDRAKIMGGNAKKVYGL